MSVCNDPTILACPAFASMDEVEQLVETARAAEGVFLSLERGSSSLVSELETRLSAFLQQPLEKLGRLRLASHAGACDRLGGCAACSISLVEEEVLFPHLSLALVLAPGDLILWHNMYYDKEDEGEVAVAIEDLRTARFHRWPGGSEEPGLRLEAWAYEIAAPLAPS